jgi:hypothetical protein
MEAKLPMRPRRSIVPFIEFEPQFTMSFAEAEKERRHNVCQYEFCRSRKGTTTQ